MLGFVKGSVQGLAWGGEGASLQSLDSECDATARSDESSSTGAHQWGSGSGYVVSGSSSGFGVRRRGGQAFHQNMGPGCSVIVRSAGSWSTSPNMPPDNGFRVPDLGRFL